MAVPLQILSHYPAIPPPAPIELWESPPNPCSYLPGRDAKIRGIMTRRIPADVYHAFMDANFRRSGNLIYQPVCAGCRECRSLRVITGELAMSKSQRRCWRKNSDVLTSVHKPQPTDEKFQLYRQYLHEWHGRDDGDYDDFREFLYDSPVDSLEFEYRDKSGQLLAVGICDRSAKSLSSVYFYFDTSRYNRSLGTFGALWEIQWSAQNGIPYYYLGFYVRGCPSMSYKASFYPHEVLDTDGVWRRHESRDEHESGA
jgi:leucyl-tRNA---protein transferase